MLSRPRLLIERHLYLLLEVLGNGTQVLARLEKYSRTTQDCGLKACSITHAIYTSSDLDSFLYDLRITDEQLVTAFEQDSYSNCCIEATQ
ncbi:hypothetical protein F4808DRAFT_45626 [Astrocystis sublimbata]|nr:hypothetical protein F4808DRAFT_45626 [Astrocystis sublimbata]